MTQELAMVSGEGALLRPDWDTGRDLLAPAGEPGVDLEAAERAAGEFLAALGIDVAREDLQRRQPGWLVPSPNCLTRSRFA